MTVADPMSPALSSALQQVNDAIKVDAAMLGTPLATADDAAKKLQEEIASLQDKLVASTKARREADDRVKELESKLAENPFAALFNCFPCVASGKATVGDGSAAPTKMKLSELRASMEPELKAKIAKAMKDFCSAEDPKPLLQQGIDSLALQSLTSLLSIETGVPEEILTEQVSVDDHTTAKMLMDKVIDVAVERKYEADNGGNLASKMDEAADAKAADETAPTQPAKAEITPAEVVEQAGVDGLTVAMLGEWAALKAALVVSRPAALNHLKDAGIAKLPDRQKVAKVLSQAQREGRI